MSDLITHNTDEAIEFLGYMYPLGPVHLVAIEPGKSPVANTFATAEDARNWIERNQDNANVYFHVNPLKEGVLNRKAKKADVAAGSFLHVDIDDLEALERILEFSPRPTAILMSGGGYQVFWALETDCDDLDLIERCNLAISLALGGDSCHNVDRIMRVPGTINVPSAKKRKAGRTKVLAKILTEHTDWNRKYTIGDF
jgi:RepB DNA-primase N-terminal domain